MNKQKVVCKRRKDVKGLANIRKANEWKFRNQNDDFKREKLKKQWKGVWTTWQKRRAKKEAVGKIEQKSNFKLKKTIAIKACQIGCQGKKERISSKIKWLGRCQNDNNNSRGQQRDNTRVIKFDLDQEGNQNINDKEKFAIK